MRVSSLVYSSRAIYVWVKPDRVTTTTAPKLHALTADGRDAHPPPFLCFGSNSRLARLLA
jgi:hypothetical protein